MIYLKSWKMCSFLGNEVRQTLQMNPNEPQIGNQHIIILLYSITSF